LVEALGLGTSAAHFRYFRGRILKHHEGRQIIAAYTARAVWPTPIVAAFLSSFCMGSSEDLGSPPMGSSGIIGSLLIVLGVILGVIGLINALTEGWRSPEGTRQTFGPKLPWGSNCGSAALSAPPAPLHVNRLLTGA
jgi:hypothetical protein